MPHKTEYIAQKISSLNNLDPSILHPLQISSGGFMLCLRGDCDVVVDTKPFQLKTLDLVVAFPYSIIQLLRVSDDFESIMIGVGIDLFAQIQIPNKSSYFTTIREHPSIALTKEEADRIIELNELIMSQQSRPDHPFRGEIDLSILKIILYEVAAIYGKREPNRETKQSRDDIIFHTFIFTLLNDYKHERSLGYYAEKQLITASHLAKVVKRVSSRKAMDWLVDCVINNIKYSLQNEKLSISDIANEYNFPNASFFSQYFKRHTGMTPKEYRKRER